MYPILQKLFTGSQQQAAKQILETYHKKDFCIVDYLYFAPIANHKLLKTHNKGTDTVDFQNALLDNYKDYKKSQISGIYQKVLLESDILLPDGIALQIFYRLAKKKRLANLNGTDFCPYFLDNVKSNYGKEKINLILYGTYPDLLKQTETYLEKRGFKVIYAQDGYTNLDRLSVGDAIESNKGEINILLVARATSEFPIQEIRSHANQGKIKEYKLLVMNQGGTFDFRVGRQKRAPGLLRTIKLERLRRLITDPKRNLKKVKWTMSLFIYIFSHLLLKKG